MQMIDHIRREYEEFIFNTKLENESFKSRQQTEYTKLKKDFEDYKSVAFEEKKIITIEYQVQLAYVECTISNAVAI